MSAKYLAPGLRIHCELPHATLAELPYQCFEVCDERGDPEAPRHRIVYLFPRLDSHPWKSELLKRLHLLTLNHIDHVTRPLELGRTADGSLYVLLDKFDNPLVAELTPDSGIRADPDGSRAWALFEKITAGLVGLHRLGMAHGNLRPANIHLDRSGQAPWITESAWGPLAWWSEGKYLDDSALAYYPPEYKGKPHPPTTRADIFALGRILQEMLAGRDEDAYDKALARLSRRRRAILRLLLAADPRERAADADDLQRRMDAAKSTAVSASLVGATALVLAVVIFLGSFFLGTFFLTSRLSTLSKELATPLSKELPTPLARELPANLSRELAGPLSEHLKLRDTELKKANDNVAELTKQLNELQKKPAIAIAAPPAKPPVREEDLKLLAGWKWSTLATTSMSWNDMQRVIALESPNQGSRKQLEQWCESFTSYPTQEKMDGKWWIRPTQAQGSEKLDRWGCIEIQVDGKKVRFDNERQDSALVKYDAWHKWDEANKHTYDSNEWLGFEWSPGQAITVVVYGYTGRLSKDKKESKAFGGPVAMWLLHRDKTIGDPSTVAIDFDVYQCPGPDVKRDYAKDLMKATGLGDLLDR